MLTELEAILGRSQDNVRDILDKELQALTRHLLERQFMFADDYQNQRRYELARRYRGYFENLFEALGYTFLLNERERLVGIINAAGAAGRVMKIKHALFLLALRAIYQEHVKTFSLIEAGRAKTTLALVWSLIEERARGVRRPTPRQCEDIAREFQRNGIVSIAGELAENGDMVLEIRPVIRLVVSEATAAGLERYATEAGEQATDGAADADADAQDDARDRRLS